MAVIQRPVKTYGTRSYTTEVAAAPDNADPILANEVDGDLDTMYGAWNAGVDTVNIKDLAVTNAKLAPDAKLWTDTGNALIPAQARAVQTGVGTIKGQLEADGAVGNSAWSVNHPWAPQDTTKGSWLVKMDGGAGDQFTIFRRAANAAAGAATTPLYIRGSDGKTICTLADGMVNKGMLQGGATLRNYWAPTVPTSYATNIKNAWQLFSVVAATLSGGPVLILFAPSLELWVTGAQNSAYLRCSMDQIDTNVLFQRYHAPASSGGPLPYPGYSMFTLQAAGVHNFYFHTFCQTDCAFVGGAAQGLGSIWIIEFA